MKLSDEDLASPREAPRTVNCANALTARPWLSEVEVVFTEEPLPDSLVRQISNLPRSPEAASGQKLSSAMSNIFRSYQPFERLEPRGLTSPCRL